MDAFHRYLDTDGDHIPYRTLPGTDPRGAYFLRGSGHNKFGNYTEKGHEYKEVVDRLYQKWKSAAEAVPEPIIRPAKGSATYGIIAIGSSDAAVAEACTRLEADGIFLDYMRVRAFPFSSEVEAFIGRYEQVFIVEQNRDGQLHDLIITETNVSRDKLISVLHYSGEPLSYRFVYNAIKDTAKARKIA